MIPIGILTDDADVAMETEAVANETESALQEDGEMEEDLPPLSAAELFARRQTKLREKKRIIAMLSSALIENPEQNASNSFIYVWNGVKESLIIIDEMLICALVCSPMSLLCYHIVAQQEGLFQSF